MFEQAKKHLPLVLALKDQQASFETIIQKLREAGASQITSIKVLKACFGFRACLKFINQVFYETFPIIYYQIYQQ